MGVHGYTQNTVILFRDATKKALYLGVMRIGNAQGWFGYCLGGALARTFSSF